MPRISRGSKSIEPRIGKYPSAVLFAVGAQRQDWLIVPGASLTEFQMRLTAQHLYLVERQTRS